MKPSSLSYKLIYLESDGLLDMYDESYLRYPTVRKALLYESKRNDVVQCNLCERRCNIPRGGSGFCKTRVNVNGVLYTLVYGDLNAIESRPIEIKPFFHFWPGSTALTFSTWSCNFNCPWCQNWHLSKQPPNPRTAFFVSPEKIVRKALSSRDDGLCVSFTEPTMLFEFSVDAFKLASKFSLYNTYVSNGYMTFEALKILKDSGLNGLKIDIKGDDEVYKKYCGGLDVEYVWRNAREAKQMGIHVEMVNLLISGVNDDEECIRWIIERHLKEVGPDTPIHFTRYYPAYKFHNPPTKIEKLEFAYNLAKKLGVNYPYIGNVPGHSYENTYCPECGELLIKRYGYTVVDYRVTSDSRCPRCGRHIPITGKYIKKRRFI